MQSYSQAEEKHKQLDKILEQLKVAPLRKSISKNREESYNISKKSEKHSINNLSSGLYSSIAMKNTQNYHQMFSG